MRLLNARFIDQGIVQDRVDVEIENDRIKSITPSSQIATPEAVNPDLAEVIDLAGHTILAGLIDLHIHIMMDAGNNPEASLKAPAPYLTLQAARRAQDMLQAGITTARDCGGFEFAEMSLRRAIAEGWLPGPRLLVSGPVLTMTGGHGHFIGTEVDGEASARRAARYNIKQGADCIKMMATGGVMTAGVDPNSTQLSEAELRAGFEEALKAGKLTATHAGGAAGIKNAIRAGVQTVEHGIFLDEEAVRLMLENNVFLSATLSAPKMIVEFGEAAGVPKFMVDKSRRVMEQHLKSFEMAYRAGVKIGCGSDAGTPFNKHHDLITELQLMQNGGMSTLEALKAATLVSAQALRLDQSTGSLEPGKLADLIVVDGDPRTDIEVLRKPALVFKAGNLMVRRSEARVGRELAVFQAGTPTTIHSQSVLQLC